MGAHPLANRDSLDTCPRALQRSTVGHHAGWRRPEIEELASLVDPAMRDGVQPALLLGDSFLNVQAYWYWSATAGSDDKAYAFGGFQRCRH